MGPTNTQREHRRRVEEALSRWNGTRTDAWIARQLGISERTLENWRCRLGYWKTNWRGWYTVNEAARVTGLSSDALNRMCRTGKVRARKVPKCRDRARYAWWLIAPEDVERLIQDCCPETMKRWRMGQ